MEAMNAIIEIQKLLPAWEQFRAATDISPIRDEAHYIRMTQMLDSLLDEAGGDERHPVMGLVISRIPDPHRTPTP
jgi:HTH-type transcriptional regulator/antitoxin HigA